MASNIATASSNPWSWRRFLSLFTIDHTASARDIYWAVGIAAILGALYGALVTPFWSEAVAFGQAWAGLIDYSHSSWGATLHGDGSLQIIVPALLLRAGFDVWALSLAASALFSAIAFSAFAAATFVFTRHIALSVAMPILMLAYVFTNAHGYPIMYPVSFFQFGQTGMYLCLLALALAAGGLPLIAGLLGGLLAGVHAVWCVCFVVGAFPALVWLQRRQVKRLASGFVIAAVAALGLQFAGTAALPPYVPYQPPVIPAPLSLHTANSVMVAGPGAPTAPAVHKKVRNTFEAHNPLFADAPSPWKAALTFFLPTATLLILSILLWRLLKKLPAPPAVTFSTQKMLVMVSIPLAGVTIFKLLEELDPGFGWTTFISDAMPGLIIRAIFTRWLNLASLLVPAVIMGILLVLARNYKSWLAALALIAIICLGLAAVHPVTRFNLDIKELAVLLAAVAAGGLALAWPKPIVFHPQLEKLRLAIVPFILIGFFIAHLITLEQRAAKERLYTGSDNKEAMASVARMDKGQLIISPGVEGRDNFFMTQLRTGRAIVLPSMLKVYDKGAHKIVDVFCYTDTTLPFAKFYADVKPCFENRSPREWAVVGKELTATGLITPSDWQLKIPVAANSGGLSYYHLVLSSKQQP